MSCDFCKLIVFRHSLPAVIRSLRPFAPCRHSLPAVIPSEARNLPAPHLPLAPCGAMSCDGRGKLRWFAGRFLRSVRSCLAHSGRNDGCERGNDGCERGNDGCERGNDGCERGNDGCERGNDGCERGNDGCERGNDDRE
ncbi:MAG: hypothetical protein LBO71_01010 [Prevotellaceae bacterium]|nr:hypothetical protein [Prevotellaceae bacterium]